MRRGATTLLEHDRASWTVIFRNYLNDPNQFKNAAAFLSFAVEQLTDLIEGSGWEREYPRDVWQLRRLGYIPAAASRQLNFTDIQQRWLVDCAKRWLHWRLTVEEKSINTVSADLLALRRLSAFLTATGQARYSIRQLTRPVLEQHIAWLHQQPQLGGSATIRDSISALAVFLRALQDHEDWAPDLPRNAVIFASDYPRTIPLRARGLNAHIMTQVRAHLPRWPQPDGRFLTELMLATGLRVGDACALGYDPIVRDRDDNPYVRYWNHKMRREAYVPISAATLDKVREQQARVREQYPAETAEYLSQPAPRILPVDGLRLLPANMLNPHGLLRFRRSTYNLQLQAWVAKCGITDEAGRPAHITAHQWRHTFATTLVNRGVRLEVVKQLLDHASLEMAVPLRPAAGHHHPRRMGRRPRQRRRPAAPATGRRRVGEPITHRPTERPLRTSAPTDLRPLQQVPDLPRLHHHQRRPACARGAPPPHADAHRPTRRPRADQAGRPEPARTRATRRAYRADQAGNRDGRSAPRCQLTQQIGSSRLRVGATSKPSPVPERRCASSKPPANPSPTPRSPRWQR